MKCQQGGWYNMRLGQYTFPFDPPVGDYSGLNKKKSRTDIQTLTSNKSISWGFILEDNFVVMKWNIMKKDFFQELQNRHYNNNGANIYEFETEDGEVYNVEIVDFGGTPYGTFINEHTQEEAFYYKDVEMKLKILERIV
jgi:hypothetical protein